MSGQHNIVEGKPSSAIFPEMGGILNQALLRQALYKFIAAIFLYPDEEMLKSLQEESEELKNISSVWAKHLYAEKLRHLLEQISSININDRKTIVNEYNRLFLVNPAVSPYETSYLKKSGQSEPLIAAELSGLYSQAGLEVSPEINDLPDHIAIEFEFMSFLCANEIHAIQEEDSSMLSRVQKQQIDFMSKHLALWYPEFAKKAFEESNEELIYRSVVETAFAFLHNELSILGISSKEN